MIYIYILYSLLDTFGIINSVKGMTSWLNRNISHKLTALLIVGVFVVVTFSCFTIADDHGGHSFDAAVVCETVLSLADTTIIQIGVMLLLVAAAAHLCFRTFNPFSLQNPLYRLLVFHGPPPDYLFSPKRYSYLQKLFSSGLIHSKLHSVA